MNWQQKVWKYGRVFYRAFVPVIALMGLPIALRFFASRLFGTDPDDANGDFYYALGLYFFLMIFVRKRRKKGISVSDWVGFRSWKEDGRKLAYYAAQGVGLNLMLTAALSLLVRFSWLQRYEERTHGLTDSTNAILIFASICVLAPIAEEITLRGAMLRELMGVYSQDVAILIVSAVFAVGHGNLIWTCYTFCFGVYLARTAIRENMRLIFPIVLHCGFNMPSLISYFVNNSKRAVRLLERYPALFILYFLLGAGIFAGSRWISRYSFATLTEGIEREDATV